MEANLNTNKFFLASLRPLSIRNFDKFFQNELINFDILTESSEFKNADLFDFSNIETANDFLFWKIGKILSKNKNFKEKINFEYFILNGCSNITIWSLHYLNKIFDKDLFSSHSIKVLKFKIHNLVLIFFVFDKLNERFSCCERISESLLVSLNYDKKVLVKNGILF